MRDCNSWQDTDKGARSKVQSSGVQESGLIQNLVIWTHTCCSRTGNVEPVNF